MFVLWVENQIVGKWLPCRINHLKIKTSLCWALSTHTTQVSTWLILLMIFLQTEAETGHLFCCGPADSPLETLTEVKMCCAEGTARVPLSLLADPDENSDLKLLTNVCQSNRSRQSTKTGIRMSDLLKHSGNGSLFQSERNSRSRGLKEGGRVADVSIQSSLIQSISLNDFIMFNMVFSHQSKLLRNIQKSHSTSWSSFRYRPISIQQKNPLIT